MQCGADLRDPVQRNHPLIKNPIDFSKIPGNPYGDRNLPPNYDELTPEFQRLARVNAVSLCDTPRHARESWARFVDYYLTPDEDAGFDPGFFKPPVHPSPPLHYKIVEWLHTHKRVALGAPRGSAKSTVKRSVMLWKVVTKPRYDACMVLAKDDFVVEEFYKFKTQLENNSRILEDFGTLRPPRGTGIWHNHILTLSNGSILRGISIGGRSRGLRPDLVWLDDPEFDDDYMNIAAERVEELKEKCLGVVLPMLEGSGVLVFTNTMLSQNSFGYHVVCTEEDPRFLSSHNGGTWFKVNVPAVDALGQSIWAAKYTPEFLAERETEMGGALFDREYMGQPRSDQAAPFSLHPEKHEYIVTPGGAILQPWTADGKVEWHDAYAEKKDVKLEPKSSTSLREFFGPMRRILTVDYSEGLSSSSDYSAIVVGGLDRNNVLWVLDAWQGRVRTASLAQTVWDMAEKWRVGIIAVESVSTQMEIFRYIREFGAKQEIGRDLDWLPQVLPLRYPANLSKEGRIMGLEWRFNQGRIKLPAHLKMTRDGKELFRQIKDFTPDGRGLPHDDLVDTLSMQQYVLRASTEQALPERKPRTPLELLLSGEIFFPGTEIPLITAINLKDLHPDVLEGIMVRTESYKQERDQGNHWNPLLDSEPIGYSDVKGIDL